MALMFGLIAASIVCFQKSQVATSDDGCAPAEHEVAALLNLLADSPASAAKALSEAFYSQSNDAALLLPPNLRPQGHCQAFEASAAPILRFLSALHLSVQAPAQEKRQGRRPRVLVVGAGPAGLPAALVAHREGASVSIVEQRTNRTRPVWFDLEPSPDDSDKSGKGGSNVLTSQAVLQQWGFFELASAEPTAPFRVTVDERGSGICTVQCLVLERFLEVCARLVGIEMSLGVSYSGACADPATGDVHAVLSESRSGRGDSDSAAALLAASGTRANVALVLSPCSGSSRGSGASSSGGSGSGSGSHSTVAFDLLIGADGPRSAVRTSLDLAYPARANFSSADGQLVRSTRELSQVSLIVSFALEPSGLCPQLKRDTTSGLPAPPYDISFDEPGGVAQHSTRSITCAHCLSPPPLKLFILPLLNRHDSRLIASFADPLPSRSPIAHARTSGISSVFKRLYEPYCELQILFERATGEALFATFEAHQGGTRLRGKRGVAAATSDEAAVPVATALAAAPAASTTPGDDSLDAALARALPLPLLLRVCNKLLRAPFADERQLLAALRRPSADSPPDAIFFRIAIRRAEAAGRVLLSPARGCALALLRGDSLVAPPYRLGVGVNHAMATLPYLAGLLQDLWQRGGRAALRAQHGGSHCTAGEAEAMELLESWEHSTGADANALVDYQLGVIYLEVHCGLLVLGDRIFRRDLERRSLEEVSFHELESFGC